ncbi:hypothetical protein GGF37_004308 [Kickxella alabastrina]|nr:hypothetical protein GGF37_004308 [Kickxella alabastrina]
MAFTYFQDLNRRLRQPGGPPYYFRIANIIVAILMIISAIVFFIWANFMRIMLGIFEIIFGLFIIMFELAELAWLTPYVQFMFTWRGRGLFYVFIGCLTLGYKALGWVFGAIITAIGAAYVVLSFTAKKNESYVSNVVSGSNAGSEMYGDQGSYPTLQQQHKDPLDAQHSTQNAYLRSHQQQQQKEQNLNPLSMQYESHNVYSMQGHTDDGQQYHAPLTNPTQAYDPTAAANNVYAPI